jgi:hypothetical protein
VSEPDFRPGDVVTPARRGYGRPTPLHQGGLCLEAGKPVTVIAVLGGGGGPARAGCGWGGPCACVRGRPRRRS